MCLQGFKKSKAAAREIAKCTAGGVTDEEGLDTHAISELQNKGVPFTDDSFKYNYTADGNSKYCE